MASTSDFRNGYTFSFNNDIYKIVEFMHVKPGKGNAFVRTKLKSITSGKVIDKTWRAGERIEEVRLDAKKMQYLYSDDSAFHFMDMDSFEQIPIPANLMEDVKKFLKESMEIKILFHGNEPIDIEIPPFVVAEIVQTDPGLKGDTATGGSKPATLETGYVLNVPLFVQQGEKVKVDTRSGEYVERVK